MAFSEHWILDPSVTYLNHGSFGACPRAVLAAQSELRERLEREPVQFLARELEARMDAAREAIATFLGAEPEDLVFVPNATVGINTVLATFPFARGDEVIVTNHGYNACNNAAAFWAERAGASVRSARVPFPSAGPEEVLRAVRAELGPRTRLLLVDHVTSPTGLVFPLSELIAEMHGAGVRVLVDGAHAPGMLELSLRELQADYYTGNFHKWCSAPKSAAFLFVRSELQAEVRPLVISHGANSKRTDRSRFRLEFDWTGTLDPTAVLSVPTALALLESLLPGGWPALRAHNRELALHGRRLVADALGVRLPCPDAMIGSLAALPLPRMSLPQTATTDPDPLHLALFERDHIEVPVFSWPPERLVRISAAAYNELSDYTRLAEALAHYRDAMP